MSKKAKLNIPGFDEIYYSNNVEYKIIANGYYYIFYKKGTNIFHNEYGPAVGYKDGGYEYLINDEYHRLIDIAYNNSISRFKGYYVIGKYLGVNKEEFIKNLANVLIRKNKKYT